ncbi:MAG: hypothetical protein F6K18_26030 [Okeania sp. SIO2C2]|nr:hypothetical protein [Okeania sp. SIO2C2]NEP90002.1 hypothetical protein [Okeania sp. SIO2C2]
MLSPLIPKATNLIRRQETGDRRQEKWIGSEEVGVRIVRMIFLPKS